MFERETVCNIIIMMTTPTSGKGKAIKEPTW